MTNRTLLADLAKAWHQGGLVPAAPASPEALGEFEARHHVHFPADCRAYFATLNGGKDGRNAMTADQMIAFWRLDEVEPRPNDASTEYLFWFADFLIDSHAYAIRLSADAEAPAPVFIDHGTSVEEVAPSLSAFLHAYIAKDEKVLFGSVPPPSQPPRARDSSAVR
jgi:hypothetical protein